MSTWSTYLAIAPQFLSSKYYWPLQVNLMLHSSSTEFVSNSGSSHGFSTLQLSHMLFPVSGMFFYNLTLTSYFPPPHTYTCVYLISHHPSSLSLNDTSYRKPSLTLKLHLLSIDSHETLHFFHNKTSYWVMYLCIPRKTISSENKALPRLSPTLSLAPNQAPGNAEVTQWYLWNDIPKCVLLFNRVA